MMTTTTSMMACAVPVLRTEEEDTGNARPGKAA